jgi:hypothetical protein
MPEEFPADTDSVLSSILVTDNIRVKNVVFKYKRYQDTVWSEEKITPAGSTYNYYIRDDQVGSHGMFYYIKASDYKDNTDSTGIVSMVLRYTDPNSPEIENLIFGAEGEDYQIISIPLDLESNRVENVFDELLPYDIKKWRLFHYNNGITGEYGEGFSTINPGKGYWLIVRNKATIQVGDGRTVRIEDEDGFGLVLQPGWNQVGNPYRFTISWDDLLIYNNNDNISRIKVFRRGELTESGLLSSFEGGFVFLGGDQSAIVRIPPHSGFKNKRMAESINHVSHGQINSPEWFISLNAKHGKFKNTLNGIGMHPNASVEFDPKDEPWLPLPAEISGFEMYFPHEDQNYDKLSKDLVSPVEFYTWEFEIKKHGESGIISLDWDNSSFGQNDFTLLLMDVMKERLIDMRAEDTYKFYASGIRRFRIYYGKSDRLSQEILPGEYVVGDLYPNPFSDVINIPLALPDYNGQYKVDVSLMDMAGNRLQPVDVRQLEPGYQEFTIRPKTTPLQNGLYFLRIIVSTANERRVFYRKILKW